MIKVRGIHLIHQGRGYHDVEVELAEGVARHYINLGQAVEVNGVQETAAAKPSTAAANSGNNLV